MIISKRWMTGLLALTMAAGACLGEEADAAKFYKLEFVVKEVAGSKVLNSRTYTTMIATGPGTNNKRDEIRAGSKIPYASTNTNFEMIDVGVNLDIYQIKEMQDRVSFTIVAEVSSVAEGANETRPTIRQNKWSSDVVVPIKKPTLLFSSENVDAKSMMQVEVTATPVP